MALCSIAIQFYGVLAIRRETHWRAILPFVAGGLLTLPLGVYWLTRIPGRLFGILLGLFLIAYGLQALVRPTRLRVRGNRWIDVAVGALGGITGGMAAFPSASVTIWCTLRGWDKDTSRGLYQPYILIMQVAAIAWLHAGTTRFVDAGVALPCVAVALGAAHFGMDVFHRLNDRQFSRMVYLLLALSGAILLIRAH